jgi:hypothetical protein
MYHGIKKYIIRKDMEDTIAPYTKIAREEGIMIMTSFLDLTIG